MDIYVIALILVPAFVGLATAAAVDDWYDNHSHKRHPVRWKISSKQSVIKVMEEK